MEAALGKFLLAVAKALEDGWQPTQDVPVIVTEAFKDFWPFLAALIGAVIPIKKA